MYMDDVALVHEDSLNWTKVGLKLCCEMLLSSAIWFELD